MERYVKKCIRLKKSINDKIDIINNEIGQHYSYQTLEYLLELGILKYEEEKLQAKQNQDYILILEDVKNILEKLHNE